MRTPILETDRLVLRPFIEADVTDVFECQESDPDVAKYMFWTSHNDIEKTREWIAFELGQIEKQDWYRFAIVLKGTNTLIGTALVYYEEESEGNRGERRTVMAKTKGVSSKTHTQKQLDDYANQHNPNNKAYWANQQNKKV